MRPKHEVERAKALFDQGLNDCEIARAIGTGRHNVRYWRTHGWEVGAYARSGGHFVSDCPRCDGRGLDERSYSYLLGLYLGDGSISRSPGKIVFRLRIVLDQKYPIIIGMAADGIVAVRAGGINCVGFAQKLGCIEVYGFWKHWPCLFPQHGPGRKHLRTIVLEPWQDAILYRYPRELLRGLIHSDGCRDLNVVNGKSYPRYSFTNNSSEIKAIFCRVCDRLGVHYTRPSWKAVSISRDVTTWRRLTRSSGPRHERAKLAAQAPVPELEYGIDSKPIGLRAMWVRIPPGAPTVLRCHTRWHNAICLPTRRGTFHFAFRPHCTSASPLRHAPRPARTGRVSPRASSTRASGWTHIRTSSSGRVHVIAGRASPEAPTCGR